MDQRSRPRSAVQGALSQATKSPLYRCHTRQEACGSRRPKEGHRDRGSQRIGPGGIRGEGVLDRRELPDTLGCPGRALIVELILVCLTILGVSFGRPKTYVALRRQTRKPTPASRTPTGAAPGTC